MVCEYCRKNEATHYEGSNNEPVCDACCIQGKTPSENRKRWMAIQKRAGIRCRPQNRQLVIMKNETEMVKMAENENVEKQRAKWREATNRYKQTEKGKKARERYKKQSYPRRLKLMKCQYQHDNKFRKKVRVRVDSKRFVKKGKACELCGRTENLQFHHPTYEVENVITICEICHGKIHGVKRIPSGSKSKGVVK